MDRYGRMDMDGGTWMDMDGGTWMDMDGRMDTWIERHGWRDMDGHGWRDMDEWMDGWMDGVPSAFQAQPYLSRVLPSPAPM